MIFVGDDWAEAHHDVCLMDEAGTRLAARRLPEGLPGVAVLHEMVAEHTWSDAGEVVVGIETDRGLWVEGPWSGPVIRCMRSTPKLCPATGTVATAWFGSRNQTAAMPSVLADLVRTDRHNLIVWGWPVTASRAGRGIKSVVARAAYQNLDLGGPGASHKPGPQRATRVLSGSARNLP